MNGGRGYRSVEACRSCECRLCLLFAGVRSGARNDFSQYPVFPWVLADYSSPQLNLEAPEG